MTCRRLGGLALTSPPRTPSHPVELDANNNRTLDSCESGGACVADFNGSHSVTVQDIFDFLQAWFSGDPRADVNQSGTVTVLDIFAFLAAWFAYNPSVPC